MANSVLSVTEKVYTIDCPDCGQRDDILTVRQHYTNGIPHEGSHHTIDCPSCGYYEYNFVGPDI